MVGAVATARDATGDRVAQVRAWWRVLRPPPSIGQRLDVLYTTVLVGAIFGALAYGTASSALAQVVTPDWLATYAPSLALVAALLATHWGVYHGPVVFSVADVAWLLGAPLARRDLALRRLLRALAGGGAAGATLAAVLLVGLAGERRGVAAADAAGLVVGLAELGTLAVAGAWVVERSARWERAARRAVWPTAAAAAALALAADAGAVGREAARWSGPWGWAVQPGTGAPVVAWLAALVALSVVTVAAVLAVSRDCGRAPTERHVRRAEARESAIASLAGFDARSARRALEAVGGPGRARSVGAPPRPRAARLVVPWRDAVAARGAPGRVVEAVALVGAGTATATLNADRALAVVAAVLVVYAGAARLLWPLRAELDVPDRLHVLLRPRSGRVLLAHTILPGVVATVTAAVAAGACALAGDLSDAGRGVAVVAVAAAPMLVQCAAMSARRGGRLPASVLVGAMAADPTGGAGAVLAWLALWPATAAALGGVALIVAAGGEPTAILAALAGTLAAAAVLGSLVREDVDRA